MTKDQTPAAMEQWAQKAMAHLTKDRLVPTPDNFSVYYAYYANANPNLTMAMNALIDQHGGLDQGHCTELYLAHLSLEAEHKVLQEASQTISNEIKQVMGVLEQSSDDSTQYNATLNNFNGALQSTVSLEQIRSAVARVANETRVMAEQNQRLHAQLSHSTQELTEMRFNLDEVRKASLIDPLTNVGNRKYFDLELERILEEAEENGTPVSLLMGDIDHFKKFNDTFGHLIGDEVLKLVARTLVENLKGRDIIARYGGEEFVILMPQTSVNDAEKVGNQLRTILATKKICRRRTNETLGTVTISIGATQYIPKEDPEIFIDRADKALYEAKQTGRNKVIASKPE